MQTEQKSIRVMLADDHPIVMTGFAMSLAGVGMDVVGRPRRPDEAAAMYAELKPDVVVLDIRFGTELTGLDAAAEHPQADPAGEDRLPQPVRPGQPDQGNLPPRRARLRHQGLRPGRPGHRRAPGA